MGRSEDTGVIKKMDAEDFRSFIESHHPDDFLLLDLRAAEEYRREHLPGAVSVPYDSLPVKADELDRAKTMLLYSDQRVLCRAAATVLVRSGVEHVRCLDVDLKLLGNTTSKKSPEEYTAGLLTLDSAQEQAAMAWQMEESARSFYAEMARIIEDPEISALFSELAAEEMQHKNTLQAIWEALNGHPAEDDFPGTQFNNALIMEGGLTLAQALAWAENQPP